MKSILLTGAAALALLAGTAMSVAQTSGGAMPPAANAPPAAGSPAQPGKAAGAGNADTQAQRPNGSGAPVPAQEKAQDAKPSRDNAQTAPAGKAEKEPKTSASGAADEKGTRASGADTQPAEGKVKSGRAAASVTLNTEQRTTIRERIVTSNVEKVAVHFNISVGTAIPRTVRIHTLPVEIVRLVPEYQGYSYIILADGRIVIIEPASYEIVTIIAV